MGAPVLYFLLDLSGKETVYGAQSGAVYIPVTGTLAHT